MIRYFKELFFGTLYIMKEDIQKIGFNLKEINSLNRRSWFSANAMGKLIEHGEKFFNFAGRVKTDFTADDLAYAKSVSGIIILPVNIVDENETREEIITWFKEEIYSTNFLHKKKFRKMFSELMLGYSFGHLFRGEYKSGNGTVYDKQSLCIEITGVSQEIFLELATKICKKFYQRSLLLKINSMGLFVEIEFDI